MPATQLPPPASGAWREGDPPGARRFVDVGPVDLESGGRLDQVRVAFQTWGSPSRDRSNAVLVLHALTGDSHVVGPAGPGHPTPGWWDGLIGPGAPIDTRRWYVVAPNVLGGCQGTTGPSSLAPDGRPYGSRFPYISVADQVEVEVRLAQLLGIRRWSSVIGGSMGGMRALEWAAGRPDQVASALVVAVSAAASADQIGTQTAQVLAITSDPGWNGGDYHDRAPGHGPTTGLGIARQIAHLTYRSESELQSRFGNQRDRSPSPRAAAGYAVASYLQHQADKLAHRFDAGSYVALTSAMTSWDLGRGRTNTDTALRSIGVPLVVAGIDSDRLYPLYQQVRIADQAPGTVSGLRVLTSARGHDGFLVERQQVFALVAETLELSLSAAA